MGVGLGRMITVDKGARDELEDFVEKDDWYRDLQHGPPLENGQRAEGEDNLQIVVKVFGQRLKVKVIKNKKKFVVNIPRECQRRGRQSEESWRG